MKILLHASNFAPELAGIGKYTGETAKWLCAQGHEVRVVTAPPYYPSWTIAAGYSAFLWRRERVLGADVWRCPLWVPSRPNGKKRILHLASFCLSSFFVMIAQLRWRPDIVWVVEPPLFCSPSALMTAALCRAKCWLHIQDFEVDAAFDMGLINGRWLRHWAATAERWLLRRFDRVSTISSRMLSLAETKGVDRSRLVSFPNWVDTHVIAPLLVSSPYRAELGIAPEAVVALYSGNMGNKQGLNVLASVARQLQGYSGLVFVFCGNGAGKADLINSCQGLANVCFLDLQPLERLSDLLGLADVHLLPQRADAADLVMPSKLTGMLASGRAVIATAAAGTELAMVVQEKAQCGLVVPPENADELAGALMELAANPPRRAVMGANGRAYAQRELDGEAVLRRFEKDLLACMAEK